MKINVKAFVIALSVIISVPMIVLFIWSSYNGFGILPVKIFESIHPSGGMSIVENIDGTFMTRLPGVLIDSLYIIVDSVIISFAFSKFYNYLSSKFPEIKE